MLTFHPQADTFISLKFGILEDSSQWGEALLYEWKLTVFLTHQRGQLSVSHHAFCALYLNTKENDLLDKMFSFILIFALILSLTHFSSFLTLTQTEALYECVNKGGIGSKGNISVTSIRMIMVLQLPRLRLTKHPATESLPAVHVTDRVSGSGWRSAQRRSLKGIRRFLSKIFKIYVLLWVYVLKKSMCDLPNNRWSCSSGESGKESGTGGCSFNSTRIHQSYFEMYYFDNCGKKMPLCRHWTISVAKQAECLGHLPIQ